MKAKLILPTLAETDNPYWPRRWKKLDPLWNFIIKTGMLSKMLAGIGICLVKSQRTKQVEVKTQSSSLANQKQILITQ